MKEVITPDRFLKLTELVRDISNHLNNQPNLNGNSYYNQDADSLHREVSEDHSHNKTAERMREEYKLSKSWLENNNEPLENEE